MTYLVEHPILILIGWVVLVIGIAFFVTWALFGLDWLKRHKAQREWDRAMEGLAEDESEFRAAFSELPPKWRREARYVGPKGRERLR